MLTVRAVSRSGKREGIPPRALHVINDQFFILISLLALFNAGQELAMKANDIPNTSLSSSELGQDLG